MTSTASTLDLSRLAPPALLAVDFEMLRSTALARFVALWNEKRSANPALPEYSVASLETDPVAIVTDEFVFIDLLLRQLVNDLADGLRLVSAVGADLDHLARTYHATPRLVLSAATDTTAEVLEGDDALRARAQLSSEALAQFGLVPGGYVYRIKTLYGDQVLDVAPVRTGGGGIDLVILGRGGDGAPATTLIGDLAGAFAGQDASQSTDIVTVRPADILATPVHLVLGVRAGPDKPTVAAAARLAVQALADARHLIGETLHVQAIGAAASVGPVRYVRVVEPVADVIGGLYGAPYVSEISIEFEEAP